MKSNSLAPLLPQEKFFMQVNEDEEEDSETDPAQGQENDPIARSVPTEAKASDVKGNSNPQIVALNAKIAGEKEKTAV